MKSKNLAKAIALGLVLGSMSFVSMEAQAANLNGPVGGNAARYSDLQAVNNQVERIDQRVERMDQVLSNAADKDYVNAAVKTEKTEREKEDTRIEGKVDTETNRAQNEEKRIEGEVRENRESIAEEAAARQNADDTLNEKIDRNAAATQEQIDGINVTNEKQDNAIATNTKDIADNKEQIATNGKNIAANTEAIESNREYFESRVNHNQEQIDDNKEAIAEEAVARQNADDTLNEKIDRNAAATQEQIDGINVTNEKQDNAIATNTKDIADNKEQIATNGKNIAANTEAIESNREYFESRVNHNQEQIDANKEAIADVNGKVGDTQYSSENYIAKGDDLTTAAGKLDAAVKAEETKRQNEDARIEGKVDAETNRAQNEEKRIEQKFDGEVSRLDSKIDKLDNRVEKVGAMAAAIANLHTMGYDPAAPTEVAVGVGQYRDKTGLALGAFHYPNRDVMVSFSISTAGEEYMAGVGATWKFGRKSPEAMLKAEKEKAARKKLAQETAAKKAAEDAAVAVQQAKHSEMLAAESK
ncbi:YadA-like family protein [uncultured Phascolarctobacterium sp.]|uniref:YadA C-terminal domain-containing protein n=1 Tax=uncultured Phascolarctobacterium sp. TaxID=512296 RepID=UPI0027D98BCC|nr:YadA-like family protein [uncultured Phascolarctobacterium sp.]